MIYHNGTPVTEVILHTAATPSGWAKGKTAEQVVEQIRGWHKDLGWRDIGYHRVFMPDGSMGVGRSLYETGAHVAGHNTGTIGICMIPVNTHNGITKFGDYFTEAQREAVKAYIAELCELTDITKVTGHNEYANKECPGFYVNDSDWLPSKKPVATHKKPIDTPVSEAATSKSESPLVALLKAIFGSFFSKRK